jgi:chitinase
VQFYNNQPCEIGSGGFNDSLTKWAAALQASTSAVKPRLYVGAPAWSPAGASAYANIGSPKGMQSIAKQSHDSNPVNFGGVMFWDGPEGMLNVEGGKDIIAWAKSGLTS